MTYPLHEGPVMPTKYETNTWYGWNGGECPVPPKTRVQVVTKYGEQEADNAENWTWTRDARVVPIRAFCIVEPYAAPLEVWIPVYAGGCLGGNYDSEEQAARFAEALPGARVALFREVQEGGDT